MYTKNCPICGAEFETVNSRYIYCSDACRKEADKRRCSKRNYNYHLTHKYERHLYYKQHYQPVKKYCEGCGTKLDDGRQSWCLDCLLQDYMKGSVKAIHRLNSRGFDKAMILEEIDFRRITV